MPASSEPLLANRRHPHVHLLTYEEPDLIVFRKALDANPLPTSYSLSTHTGSLRALDPSVRFDAIVSPANSYGRMDGGFDDILSRAFSPPGDYLGLTHVVQAKLWEEWRGFAPPGTCTLVPFEFTSYGVQRNTSQTETPWGCRIIAVCPTMRIPQDVRWDREVVYECMWSLLCAIDKWNAACIDEKRINSILMTPLATATGRVPTERWATQVLLAMRHFDEACAKKEKWSRLEVRDVIDLSGEVAATHKM